MSSNQTFKNMNTKQADLWIAGLVLDTPSVNTARAGACYGTPCRDCKTTKGRCGCA